MSSVRYSEPSDDSVEIRYLDVSDSVDKGMQIGVVTYADGKETARYMVLHRDAVAALVGQLASWLERN